MPQHRHYVSRKKNEQKGMKVRIQTPEKCPGLEISERGKEMERNMQAVCIYWSQPRMGSYLGEVG